jgi:hypothetical protein
MSNNTNLNISANTPALDGVDNIDSRFARSWYGFFVTLAQKVRILDGGESTSATAGVASALPVTPAGYLTIIDSTGADKKVPYYNP